MSLKPFFSYFGGKYRVAPRYPKPIYDTIVEPFAGSAGYSLRYSDLNIILNDLDPVLYETWDYLIRSSPEDILNLPLISPGEKVNELNIPLGAQYLIGWNLNKGSSSPAVSPSAWMRNPEYASQFWGVERRERIAYQVNSIHHWKITNKSYTQIDNQKATWFIDPPYQNMGKHYKKSAKNITFDELGRWCQNRSGQVIVCEAGGANWLPFEDFGSVKATSGKQKKTISTNEVVYYQSD